VLSSRSARSAGLDIRAEMSGSEDLIVCDASRDFFLSWGAGVGSGGVGAGRVSGRDVKAKGADMAEMTPPKAE
jgi:hypothetical protein